MNRVMTVFLVIFLFWVSANQADANVYKWKDNNGKWHFTDDATKVPKNDRPPSRQTLPRSETSQPHQKKESRANKERQITSHSSGKNLEKGIDEGFRKLGEALGEGLGKGMQKLGEEMGKAFEGMGELMVIAEQNKPDPEQKVFKNKEEEAKHNVKQVLIGMFLMCQFQFIIEKSETCSKDGLNKKSADGWKVKEDSEMKKKFEDYEINIDPKKNTRHNLLIKAKHKKLGEVWEITHEGKKSLKETVGLRARK